MPKANIHTFQSSAVRKNKLELRENNINKCGQVAHLINGHRQTK